VSTTRLWQRDASCGGGGPPPHPSPAPCWCRALHCEPAMLQQNVLIWRYRLVCCARWVDPSMSMATPVSHVGTRQPRSFAYRPAPRRPRRRPVTRPAAAAARRLASAPRPRPRPVVGAAARPRQSCVPSAKNGGCHKAGSRQGAVPWADIRQSVGADAAESSCCVASSLPKSRWRHLPCHRQAWCALEGEGGVPLGLPVPRRAGRRADPPPGFPEGSGSA
jgi:hypothetical protein